VVEPEIIPEFVTTLTQIGSLSAKRDFSPSFPDSFFRSLVVIFQSTLFPDPKSFLPLRDFVIEYAKEYTADVRIQSLITQLFTTLLLHNPILTRHIFYIVFHTQDHIATAALLAVANTFAERDDFATAYSHGIAAVVASALQHTSSTSLLTRQASFKLLTLMITKPSDIYTVAVPTSLSMGLTSQATIGYTIQAKHFVVFASKALKPVIAFQLFIILLSTFNRVTEQARLIGPLVEFVPLMIAGGSLDDTLTTMISFTALCRNDDAPTALAVKNLWAAYCRCFRGVHDGRQRQLIGTVFDFGVAKQRQTSVIILSLVFNEFPEETAEFLLPHVLRSFSRTIPADTADFVPFLKSADLTLVPSEAEIIASNALSQIFLMIEAREQFVTLFRPQIESIVLAAVITRSAEEFNIGNFHPLLDSLLDAALFRFAANHSTFTSNLVALQSRNLIKRATSLGEEDLITTDEAARTILAYDDSLIVSLVELFAQVDPDFGAKFFAQVLAFAFQIAPECIRSVEPLLIVRAIGREMPTPALYHLLLFTLYAFQTNRMELMDSLVDCIRSHLVGLPSDGPAFEVESMPSIVVLILYLSLKIKHSTAVQIMGIIAEIIAKVCDSPARESVRKEVFGYLRKFKGDQFIASLFLKFVREITSFADHGIRSIINCLDSLSLLLAFSNNWCGLLALLVEGARAFIGLAGGRTADVVLAKWKFDSVDHFTALLRDIYSNETQRTFIISFFVNIVTKFKANDYRKDWAVLIVLNSLVNRDFAVPLTIFDSLIKFVSLVTLTAADDGQLAGVALSAKLLANVDHALNPELLSLVLIKPPLVQVKQKQFLHWEGHERTVVDPGALPDVPLLGTEEIEGNVIIDLWQFICERSGGAVIDFPELEEPPPPPSEPPSKEEKVPPKVDEVEPPKVDAVEPRKDEEPPKVEDEKAAPNVDEEEPPKIDAVAPQKNEEPPKVEDETAGPKADEEEPPKVDAVAPQKDEEPPKVEDEKAAPQVDEEEPPKPAPEEPPRDEEPPKADSDRPIEPEPQKGAKSGNGRTPRDPGQSDSSDTDVPSSSSGDE
jgi:hypothetical protein